MPLCRNLVERNPTCGPLWWLCAHLLANAGLARRGVAAGRGDRADADAGTARRALARRATVMTVGYPAIAARALRRGGNVSVLGVLAGDDGGRLVRAMDRAGVEVEPVVPEAMLAACRRADLVLVEADACSTESSSRRWASGLAAVAASAVDVPVWLVAGRGRRLPAPYVEAIAAAWTPSSSVLHDAT